MTDKPTSSRNNAPPKTPTWVKAFFIVICILIVIVVIVHLIGIRFDHGGAATLWNSLDGIRSAGQAL